MKIGIYAGSFDPITLGHIDIIKRSVAIVDKLIIGILVNPNKKGLFSIDERVNLIKEALTSEGLGEYDIEVISSNKLLVDVARDYGASINIRGVRTNKDYEYEMNMALINKKIYKELETILLVANNEYTSVSSSVVKEIASFGGDVSGFVPKCIMKQLVDKINYEK